MSSPTKYFVALMLLIPGSVQSEIVTWKWGDLITCQGLSAFTCENYSSTITCSKGSTKALWEINFAKDTIIYLNLTGATQKILYKSQIIRYDSSRVARHLILDDNRLMSFFEIYDEVRKAHKLYASLTTTTIDNASILFLNPGEGPFSYTMLINFECFKSPHRAE